MAEEDGRERDVPYFDRFISLPTPPFLARIHTGSNPIDATTRQPVAFITRLSNAPTAKRENNAKALHRDYLLKSITRCKEGDRVTRRLRLSITLLRTILPLQCYSNYKRHRIFHFSWIPSARSVKRSNHVYFYFYFYVFVPKISFVRLPRSISPVKKKKEITLNNVYSRYLKPHSYNARVDRGVII